MNKCKDCGEELKDLGNMPSLNNQNVIKDTSSICLKCGVLHTNKSESLDEDDLDNYKDMFEI